MRFVAILLGLSLGACATDSPNTGESSSTVVVDNKLAANKLAANKLAANKLAANKLAANKLAANLLELNTLGAGDLVCSEDGREVLAFIVSCAIAEGQTLVVHDPDQLCNDSTLGSSLEFPGEVGLANNWLDDPLDKRGKGWVSACLFARVNAVETPVQVSLRGRHGALATDASEIANYSLQEGAFYGNYFVGENEDIDWNACMGDDQAAGETGGLVLRDCAEPDGNTGLTQCGFHYAGVCSDIETFHACAGFDADGTYYNHCASDPIFGTHQHHKRGGDHDDYDHHDHDGHDCRDHHHGRTHVYQQVITTYVAD